MASFTSIPLSPIDYKVTQDNSGIFDISIDTNNAQFQGINDFSTAVNFQWFVDKRTTSSEGGSNPRERGGWVGDIITKGSGYECGSKLYTKFQTRNTQNNLNTIAAYSKNALEYFVNQGYATRVSASVTGSNITGTIISSADKNNSYSSLWKSIGNLKEGF
jgi:phage gp46-like protein